MSAQLSTQMQTQSSDVSSQIQALEIRISAAVSAQMSSQLEAQDAKILGRPPYSPTQKDLKAYGGSIIQLRGVIQVDVTHGGTTKRLPVLLVESDKATNIMGLDWFQALNFSLVIPTEECYANNSYITGRASETSLIVELQQLAREYQKIFSADLGPCTTFKAEIKLKPDARPKFYKPYNLPFAQYDEVRDEIERLVKAKVLTAIKASEWAAPIVVVKKPKGGVRICADFKVTVNPQIEIDRYPIPRIEELFHKLQNGKFFTKIDLSEAYLQVEVSEEAKKFLVINTPFGLYQYQRMPFGIASAPGLFQRLMENVIAGIPHSAVYLDDIIVSGRTNEEHMDNAYEYTIRYRKSNENANADALSRLPAGNDPEFDEEESSWENIDTAYQITVEGFPLNAEIVKEYTKKDETLKRICKIMLETVGPSTFRILKSDVLLLHTEHTRVVIPSALRNKVLAMLHEGHWGKSRMKARRYVWFPGIDKDIERIHDNCAICQTNGRQPKREFSTWPEPMTPWERVHVDFAGPFFNRMWLLLVDAYSKFPYIVELASTSSISTIAALQRIFSIEGLPCTIVSDNGPQFTAHEFESFCKLNNIQHLTTPPFHPASNGLAEKCANIQRSVQQNNERGTTSGASAL
ncbi:uncharacterized protein K02A2.6-like [Rhagoletis pomonella]|uniref:uncharacterized protein K02A2.6-like n=1 Tax=Rhagoletis pomonella TaxID=28610 RepID=UPI00177DCA13|nr:uncharacterized protein K02A2.6-like [Rhagoletis pomonella]